MSLAVPSPHHNKRFLETSEEPSAQDGSRVPFGSFNPHKRVRQVVSPGGRCASGQRGAYQVGSSAVAALCALFPRMSDKVIAEVLEEFGDNIDAAIKHLNDLHLSLPGSSAQHQRDEQQRQRVPPPPQAPSPAGVPHAAAPAVDEAALQAEQSAAETTAADAGAGVGAAPARTAEEWVELLVAQMSAAGSVGDARRRAAEVLQAFEQAVVRHAQEHGSGGARAAEVERENMLLKRAVAIQAARLQEGAARDAEVVAMRQALDAARARLQALEVQNYSLQLHLRRAADSGGRGALADTRNPHVF